MAHSKPVVVSSGAGASDLVEDGVEGFVTPPRDPKAIASAVDYFFENPSEIKRMGENARRKAERYAWSRIEEMYVELYSTVQERG